MKRCIALFLSVLLGFSTMLHAEGRITLGGAVVTLADGWKQTPKDNTIVLTPINLPAGAACTFTLLGGEDFAGSLEDRLASEWKEFEQLGRVLTDDKGHVDGAGGAVQLAGRAGIIELKSGSEAHIWLLIAGANHRIERMVFVTSSDESFAKYGPAVTEMINSAKYVAPRPLERLAGVCFGFAQVKTQTNFECWIFQPDGSVYAGFPIGGPANFDDGVERKRRSNAFGTYQVDGRDIIVTMKGAKALIRFTMSGGTWAADVIRPFTDRRSGRAGNTMATWTDDIPTTLHLSHAEPCNGLKLSATYRIDGAASSYAPRPIPSIRFTPAGDFTEDGLIKRIDPGTLKRTGGVTPSAMPADGGRGKYTIAGNTISLTHQDGAKASLTFFVENKELAKRVLQTIFVHQSKLLQVP